MDNLDEKQKALKYYEIDEVHSNRTTFIDTVEDYYKFLEKYTIPKENAKEDYIFRGISKAEQKYPSLFRNDSSNAKETYDIDDPNNIKKLNDELQYIRKFEQRASFLLSEYHTTLDLVATAQHYTIKTRLLDWTSSPLVATLFSLHGDLNNDNTKENCDYYLVLLANKAEQITVYGLPVSDNLTNQTAHYVIYGDMLMNLMRVYQERKIHKELVCNFFTDIYMQTNTVKYLNEIYLNKKSRITSVNVDSQIYFNVNKLIANKAVFLETNYSNERLTNQRGLFQISVFPNKRYMDSCIWQYGFVFINKNLKEDIINICDRLGLGYYGLMPDCQSIAYEINRTSKIR